MDLFSYELDEEQVRDNFFLPDTHLNTALSIEPVLDLINNYRNGRYGHQRWKEFIQALGLQFCDLTTFVHGLIGILYKDSEHLNPKTNEHYQQGLSLGQGNLRLAGLCRLSLENTDFPLSIRRLKSLSDWFHVVTSDIASFIMKVRMKTEPEEIRGKYIQMRKPLYLYYDAKFVLINYDASHYFMDYNTYMMIADTIHQRAITLESCHLYYLVGDNSCPLYDRISSYYSTLDQALVATRQSDVYKFIKMWEPLVIGRLQCLSDRLEISKEAFYQKMVSMFVEEEQELDISKLRISAKVTKMLEEEENPDHLGEIFGLYRHWGHPFTFVEKAIERNRIISTRYTSVDREFRDLVTATFKRMISEGFYRRFKRWPNLSTDRLERIYASKGYRRYTDAKGAVRSRKIKSEIVRAIKDNTDINKRSEEYQEIDWLYIDAKREFDNGSELNILNVLQDKACSSELTQLTEKVIRGRENPSEWDDKRVLAKWLRSDYTNPAVILKDLDDHGIEKEHLLIGLVKKERELNPTPRLFSIMPLKLKLYFGLTENLIARDIIPLIPECTMTDSLQDLQEKILSKVMWSSKQSKLIPFFISLDFEKWNLQFRQDNTIDCFDFLDGLYGFKGLISKTHRYFEQTLFYHYGDGRYMAHENGEIKENFYAQRGYQGGCEGLRQKGWTTITIAMLKAILEPKHVNFTILGQGDNQVIVIYLPCPVGTTRETMSEKQRSRMRAKMEDILDSITAGSKKFGLPLKKEETWVNSSVFSYGKNMYFNGRPLRCSLKRLCRMFPCANENYPSVETSLTSLTASAQAATAQTSTMIVPYLMMILELQNLLSYHRRKSLILQAPLYRDIKPRFYDDLAFDIMENKRGLGDFAFSLGCLNLGGTPIPNPYDFLCRGFPDPLTSQISFLLSAKSHITNPENPELWDQSKLNIIDNLLRPIMSEHADLLLLFQDPLSLNIENNTSISNVLKHVSQRVLSSSYVTNPLMKEITNISETDQEKLIQLLSSMRPFAPGIAANILASSIPGICSSLVAKFDSTLTLRNIARHANEHMSARVIAAERNMVSNWIKQWTKRGNYTIPTCSTLYADLLREKSWGRKLVGVTVPFPLHLFSTEKVEYMCTQSVEHPAYISLRYPDTSLAYKGQIFNTVGPCHPYVGSETKEKLNVGREWEIKHVPSAIRSVSSNLRIVGWFVKRDSNLCNLLREIFSTVTDTNPEYFYTKEGSITGNWIHRFRDLYRKHGGYISNLATPYSHVVPCTNTMAEYSRGRGNYSLHFQAIVISNMHKDFISKYLGELDTKVVHLHVTCKDCLYELEGNDIDIQLPPPELKKFSSESQFRVEKEKVLPLISSKFQFIKQVPIEELPLDLQSEARYQLLAREVHSALVGESLQTLPGSWFFGIDPELLIQRVAREFLIEAVGLVIYEHRSHKEDWIISRDSYDLLERATQHASTKVRSLDASRFNRIINLILDIPNYQALACSSYSFCMPLSYPPKESQLTNSLRDMIGQVSMASDRHDQLIISLGEFHPVKLLQYLTFEYLLKNNCSARERSAVMGVSKWIRGAIKYAGYRSLELTSENIFYQAIGEYEALISLGLVKHPDDYGYGRQYLTCLKSTIRTSIHVNQAKDGVIKHVNTSCPYKSKIRRLRKIKYMEGTSFLRTLTPSGICDKIIFGKTKSEIKPKFMSNIHSVILYSMINENDLGSEILVLFDGAGGTSLVCTLVKPEALVTISTYIAEVGVIPEYAEYPPTELIKNNSSAKVLTVPDVLKSNTILSADTIVMDYDFLDLKMLEFSLNSLLRKVKKKTRLIVLFVEYTQESLVSALGICSRYNDDIKLVSSTVENNSYLIKFALDPKYKVSDEMRRFDFVESISKSQATYNRMEEKIIRDYESVETQMLSYLSWIRGTDEQEILDNLTAHAYLYIRSSQIERGLYDDIDQGVILSENQATLMWILIQFYSECGTSAERIERIVGRPSLENLLVYKSVICREALALVPSSKSVETVSSLRNRSIECFFYDMSSAMTHPMWPTLRRALLVRPLTHISCNNCKKNNRAYKLALSSVN